MAPPYLPFVRPSSTVLRSDRISTEERSDVLVGNHPALEHLLHRLRGGVQVFLHQLRQFLLERTIRRNDVLHPRREGDQLDERYPARIARSAALRAPGRNVERGIRDDPLQLVTVPLPHHPQGGPR